MIACGDAPALEVAPGTATAIATGGVIPRGADAVVMIEQTELIERRRAAHRTAPRRRARAVHLLRRLRHRARRDAAAARHAHRLARNRHAGGLRACDSRCGAAAESRGAVDRRRTGRARQAAQAGQRLRQQWRHHRRRRYGSRRRAAGDGRVSRRRGGAGKSRARGAGASDMVVLSGGTSKGAGDLSHRVVSRLGKPGILVHGVALKPGKPLCLGVIGDKPIVVLPGFPTSAIFTFHAFVAPVIRARAGLPPEAARNADRARAGAHRLRVGPQGIRAGVADRKRRRPDRVSDRQRLRLGDQLLAGRRLSRDRRAGVIARRRQQGASDADRQRRARARSGDHGQP